MGKKCNFCGVLGHVAKSKVCKRGKTPIPARGKGRARRGGQTQHHLSDKPTDTVEAKDSSRVRDNGVDYLFSMDENKHNAPMCKAVIAGKSIPFTIDLGAAVHIISANVYDTVKDQVQLRKTGKRLFAFSQTELLKFKGEFEAEVCIKDKKAYAVFYVFNDNVPVSNLISHKTAHELQLLHVTSVSEQLSNASLGSEITSKFPECFSGVGMLKRSKVKLHVDESIELVAQPVRRLPFGYRDKVADLLVGLQEEEIIEPVKGVASKWVSPIVVIPKANNEIRMCIDMRKVNQAIIRERYPIPAMQEMLVELHRSSMFSTLDLQQGFFQLELGPDYMRDFSLFVPLPRLKSNSIICDESLTGLRF